jgi:hypothetical protein
MCVHSVVCGQEGITICTAAAKCVTILYSALSGTRLEQEDLLITLLQELLDTKTRIAQLAKDDPDKTTDPGRPDLFWSEDGKFLVGRPVLVVAAPWNEDRTRFDVYLADPRTYLPGGDG